MKSSDCDLSLFYALIEWRHRKTHYKKTQSFYRFYRSCRTCFYYYKYTFQTVYCPLK